MSNWRSRLVAIAFDIICKFLSFQFFCRINSVKSLHTVAVALGVERTRNELLPYILDLMDDDEEILVEMAAMLDGSFLQYVGGPLFAPHLFKPLERLCEVEEPAVREKVSDKFKNGADQVI